MPLDPAAVTLFERTDVRLGRHRVHDPRSRSYDLARTVAPVVAPRRLAWKRLGPLFDQGRVDPALLAGVGADPEITALGCCTMCAAFGLLMTEPFYRPRHVYTMADVLTGYHRETVLDERAIPGVWPPEDTGSSGLYAMQVLQTLGHIAAYRFAFDRDTLRAALRVGPVAVGTAWYGSMTNPRRLAGRSVLEITPGAEVVGGHEWIIDRDDPGSSMFGMTNSWGPDWGDHGTAWLSYGTWDRLAAEGGDVVQPVMGHRSTW